VNRSGSKSAVKWDLLRSSVEHLRLPLPEQANLEQVLQTVLTRVSQFIYNNAIALVKKFIPIFLTCY
jgi:hypothetical protein